MVGIERLSCVNSAQYPAQVSSDPASAVRRLASTVSLRNYGMTCLRKGLRGFEKEHGRKRKRSSEMRAHFVSVTCALMLNCSQHYVITERTLSLQISSLVPPGGVGPSSQPLGLEKT